MNERADNPFAVLGLEARFDLDETALQRAFLKASAAWHPDRFSDDEEREAASGKIAAINEAHGKLKDPETRANVVLALLGGPGAAEDKTLPDDLLMEMLELRDELAEAKERGDAGKLNELETAARRKRQEHLERVGTLLKQGEAGDGAALRAARVELNALRYVERLIEQLDPNYGEPV